jgi:hypothetical protein
LGTPSPGTCPTCPTGGARHPARLDLALAALRVERVAAVRLRLVAAALVSLPDLPDDEGRA